MKKPNLDYKNIFYYLSGLAGLFYLVLLILLFTGFLPAFFETKMTYALFVAVAIITTYLALVIKKIPENQRDKSQIVFLSKYFFLLALVVIAVNQFLKRQIIINMMPEITIVAIALGFLTFYAHKNRVESELESEKEKEEAGEKKRKEEFDKKFPRIAKLNLSYGFKDCFKKYNRIKKILIFALCIFLSPFIFLIRLPYKFTKGAYKEGWEYSLTLIIFLFTSFFLYIYRLGEQYFWTDEVFSFTASKMILEKGVPLFNSGLFYSGSIVYHYLLSASMFIFGINSFGSRIINVFLIMPVSIVIYYLLKEKGKRIAILGILMYLTLNVVLSMARLTRMYSLLSFIFIFSILLLSKLFNNLLHNEKNFKKKPLKYIFLLIFTLFLFYLAYQTHGLSVTLVLGSALFFFMSMIKFGFKKQYIMPFIILLLIIFGGSYYKYNTFDLKDAFFERTTLNWAKDSNINSSFYTDILKDNFFLFSLFPASISLFLVSKDKKYLFIFSVLIMSLFIISYQRQSQERYMYYLIPLIIFTISYTIGYIFYIFNKRSIPRKLIVLVIIFIFLINLNLFYRELFEISNYEESSISKHKKLEFNKILEFLKQEDTETILIADYHSAFTIQVEGVEINYLLLPEGSEKLINSRDPYFDIDYVEYKSENYESLINKSNVIVILRDPNNFKGIERDLDKEVKFNRPEVYSNLP